MPTVLLAGVDTPLVLREGVTLPGGTRFEIIVDGQLRTARALPPDADGSNKEIGQVELTAGTARLHLRLGEAEQHGTVWVMPGWLSLLPPLVAILLAIVTRRVLVSLTLGLLSGSLLTAALHPLGWWLEAGGFLLGAIGDRDNASIVIFSLLLGSMVGVISHSGGSYALATSVTREIRSARGGLLTTWGLGLLIFFDDYVNALLVGSTMKPITDRLRISREKLAFVVDGTSATVASLAVVSSWIGVELGYIQAQFRALGIDKSAFGAFLESIPYRFYPILMLVFVFLVIVMGRDFGPMLAAERRARRRSPKAQAARDAASFEAPPDDGPDEDHAAEPSAQETQPDSVRKNVKAGWFHAAAPIVSVAVVALAVMLGTGWIAALEAGVPSPGLRDVFGHADAVSALFWAALTGSVLAAVIAMVSGALSPRETGHAWLLGVRSMVLAVVVLVLAWALGDLCRELHTARYLVAMVGPSLSPAAIPALVFVLSAAVAFATGTSWGTMAIVFPLAVPLVFALEPSSEHLLLGTISSILAGSVWGDHCSPISDTTILSAMASGCDHVEHVRTQLPYALVVGLISVVVGELGVGFGWYPAWVALLLGVVLLSAGLRLVGRVPA